MIFVQPDLWGRITHCGVCGRELTDPTSVQRGIGPICNHKLQKEGLMHNPEDEMDDEVEDVRLSERLVCRYERDKWRTNVRHLVTQHSPDGFSWGYGGSGPSDLALNLAEHVLVRTGYAGERMKCYLSDCFVAAYLMHHDLKWKFIAPMPDEGGEVAWPVLVEWVQAWLVQHESEPVLEEAV